MAPKPATIFTPGQQDAIDYRKLDACVVAGPGSGKTTVLVERYRTLIEEHYFRPEQILAITFTEKAAANMKAKLAALFAHDEQRRRDLESAWVSTIHGFCGRVLRENAVAAGIDPRFRVLDTRQSDRLQNECLHTAVNELLENRRTETLDLIGALHNPELASPMKSAYDAIRSSGMTVAEVRETPSPFKPVIVPVVVAAIRDLLALWTGKLSDVQIEQRDDLHAWIVTAPASSSFDAVKTWIGASPINLRRVPKDLKSRLEDIRDNLAGRALQTAMEREFAGFRGMIFDALARFDSLYNRRKQELGSLDFNDLERLSIQLFERRPEVQAHLRAQFRQIMLDEFQDINDQQWKLLELVRGPEAFFAVGDINQSIYGFRHARPEIFANYRGQSEANRKHVTELLANFRSRQQILTFVESLLSGRPGIEERGLTAGAAFAPKTSPSIEVLKIVGEDKDESSPLEARWIAHKILSMRGSFQVHGNPAEFKDFAVLLRNGESMRPILAAFEDAGIPYVSSRRDSFLESREGRDITALLHVLANPRDEVALMTVLRCPFVGLSDEALLHIHSAGGSLSNGLHAGAIDAMDAPDGDKFLRFTGDLKRCRSEAGSVPLDQLLCRIFNDTGFAWAPFTNAGNAIESYLRLARTTGSEMPLIEFLDEIKSLTTALDLEADLSDDDQGDRVQVLTAHSAKGLEFPITMVAAMDKGMRAGGESLNFTPQHGLGIRWRNQADLRNGLKDSWHEANGGIIKTREMEESNRLLYVAMTRAEEHLILSYSVGRQKPENWAAMLDEYLGLKDRFSGTEIITRADLGHMPFEIAIGIHGGEPGGEPGETSREASSNGGAEAAVEVLPRPALSGQNDSVITVTAAALFDRCPRKYFLQRYVGAQGFHTFDSEALPEFPDDTDNSGDLPASEMGSAVHALLAGEPGDYSPATTALAQVFTESILGQRAARAATAVREWDFIADVDGILVRGKVDLWFEDAGEIVIVDYKTDDVTAADASVRAIEYQSQLALYAIAIERDAGKRPSRAYLHFLRPNALVEVPIEPGATDRARALMGELAAAQNTLAFELREGQHCYKCPYFRGMCPAGRGA